MKLPTYVLVVVAGLVTTFVSTSASAAPSPGRSVKKRGGNFGLGLSLGDPMGLSLKYFLHPNHAIQGDLGWAPLHHGQGRAGADYLWHPLSFVSNSTLDLVPYLGVGVGVAFWARHYRSFCGGHNSNYDYCDRRRRNNGGAAMFIRAPILGLAMHWKGAPLDTVFEGSWSPHIVLPDLPHGDFSFKVRYYF